VVKIAAKTAAPACNGNVTAKLTAPSAATEEHTRALYALLGLTPGAIPDKTVAMVAAIHEAKRRGLTWSQIASCTGARNGPEAKATAKRLAKLANRKLLEQAAEALRTP
jgi:hypothetical protein